MIKIMMLIAATFAIVIAGLIFLPKVTLVIIVMSTIVMFFLFKKAPLEKQKPVAKVKALNIKQSPASKKDQLTA